MWVNKGEILILIFKEDILMEKITQWIMDNWSAITGFFEKLYEAVKTIITE